MKTKKLTFTAALLSISLIIFILEAQLPPLAPIPGIKLGLANIITLFAIYALGRKEAFVILTLRIILGSVFSGNLIAFLYSISGGAVSFLFMAVMSLFLHEDRMWAVSVFGAIGHNIGQIAAALFITKTPQIIWYLPVLVISAVITGVFTGVCAQLIMKRLKSTNFLKEINDA